MNSVENEYPGNALVRHTVSFALTILSFCDELDEKKRYVVSKQLLRSGTSIGAQVIEAQSAESRADFVHKLKIADKEARETWYWLYLCNCAEGYPYKQKIAAKLSEIQRILNAILKTSRRSAQ